MDHRHCAALERGLVQKNVAAVRTERQKAAARRKDALTGTSEFPDLHEKPAAVLDVARRMGVTSLSQADNNYGMSLTLGAYPVRLADMATAASTLAKRVSSQIGTSSPSPGTALSFSTIDASVSAS